MACSLTLALTGQRAGTGPAPTLTAYTGETVASVCCNLSRLQEPFTGTCLQ